MNYKALIEELHKKQQWNPIRTSCDLVEIEGLPSDGLFWLWTSYDFEDFEEWDRPVGIIPAARLVKMTKGLRNLCSITKGGFRLVYVGSDRFSRGESDLEFFQRLVLHQFDSIDSTWNSLGILNSPQNDLSRWKVSSVQLDPTAFNSNFELRSVEWLWRMHYGTPVFNHWLFCE